MNIQPATKQQAPIIATLIMEAMNHECCQYFAGPHHTLQDFHALMTRLVSREDTQYSYRNTLVAVEDNEVMGICVAYDGARLHALREVFFQEASLAFGIDHHGIPDETQAGEYYIDSICVDSRFRGRGVAGALLVAMAEKAASEGHHTLGLLVDKNNPRAERLYTRVGYQYANDTTWGGHPMRHLQLHQ